MLMPDNGDYLMIKSFGLSTYVHKAETFSKKGPQYVHFKNECLKNYENFPFHLIEINLP